MVDKSVRLKVNMTLCQMLHVHYKQENCECSSTRRDPFKHAAVCERRDSIEGLQKAASHPVCARATAKSSIAEKFFRVLPHQTAALMAVSPSVSAFSASSAVSTSSSS